MVKRKIKKGKKKLLGKHGKKSAYRGSRGGIYLTSPDSKKKRYDLPEPLDLHFKANDLILRLVPSIDNLMELGVYVDQSTFDQILEELNKEGIKYEEVERDYIARRGRKWRATNIFIIGGE